MAGWADGYVSEVTYSAGFYRETTPAWLAMATLLAGHRPPRIDGKFRWCELGCGQGMTALGIAACHSRAEVFAFDFNPAHIDNARTLAREAGIGNAMFAEASFEDLAALPVDALPPMDFIVMHGVWSWVSSTQRAHLIKFITDRLAPGGVVYVSYNALSGWAAMLPLQRLIRQFAATRPGPADAVIQEALDFVNRLAESDAAFFALNPLVKSRLAAIARQDQRYLPHEYLNEHWQPMDFAAVARDMGEAKCSFIGSAWLLDNLTSISAPPRMAEIIAETRDPILAETLRDLGAGRQFRRDLYRRGGEKPPPGELIARLEEITLLSLVDDTPIDLKIDTALGTVTPDMAVYGPVLARLREGPLGFAELRQSRPKASALAAMEVTSILAAAGIAHPAPGLGAAPPPGVAALNRAIGTHNRQGGALAMLAAPALGSMLGANTIETIVLGAFEKAMPENLGVIAEHLAALLAETNRAPLREGKPIADPAQARAALMETLERFVAARVPLLRRTGVLAW